jgi:signal transduction histidine kinase
MRHLGRYLWPQSLYGQILLVVALGLLAAQLVNANLMLSAIRNQKLTEGSSMLLGRVVNQMSLSGGGATRVGAAGFDRGFGRRPRPPIALITSAAPMQAKGFERQHRLEKRANDYLQSTSGLGNVRIAVGALDDLPPQLREAPMRRAIINRMQRQGRARPREAILVSLRSADGIWTNAAIVLPPGDRRSLWFLLAQTITLYVAVLFPLAWIVRRVSKPLAQLTGHVQTIGLAGEIGPLESRGPADIRQLIDAFNAMQSRVSVLLGEKDVMLGAIGHDLKTPLAALRVRVESVEDDRERDKMAATIDEMVVILDDILTLARLGKSGEVSQNTDIGALISSVADDYPQATMTEPEQRIVANIRPILLRRALRNLIGNAVTYGRTARISAVLEKDRLKIIIDDDGPGIAPDLIDAMFEPFARAEISRSRATGGSGLGLTIARAIARGHHGDVVLTNRSSGGLRAIMELAV